MLQDRHIVFPCSSNSSEFTLKAPEVILKISQHQKRIIFQRSFKFFLLELVDYP